MGKPKRPEDKQSKNRTEADALKLSKGEHSFDFGLSLIVDGGSRRWITYYYWPDAITGKPKKRRYTIGPMQKVTLEAARNTVVEVRKNARAGIDPKAAHQQQAAPQKMPTFAEHADDFMARKLPLLKNEEHRRKWRGSIKNHCGPIANMPIDEIKTKDVLRVLDPIWRVIPVQAAELRGRIEKILGDGYRRLELEITNPATWKGRLEHALPRPPASGATRGSHPSLKPEAMPAFMQRLRQHSHRASARALEFTIFVCLRTQEVTRMRRGELDLDNGVWIVPNERMKVDDHGNDFAVPLAPRAVELLRQQIAYVEETFGHCDYIWPGEARGKKRDGLHISEGTMLALLQDDMGEKDDRGRLATVHGFRASFKTWAGRQMRDADSRKYDNELVELCLAHNPGSKSERAYRRDIVDGPRAAVMRAWADHLTTPPARDGTDRNVVPMRKAG